MTPSTFQPGYAKVYSGAHRPGHLRAVRVRGVLARFGSYVSGAGDVDGDGVPDFMVAAIGTSVNGLVVRCDLRLLRSDGTAPAFRVRRFLVRTPRLLDRRGGRRERRWSRGFRRRNLPADGHEFRARLLGRRRFHPLPVQRAMSSATSSATRYRVRATSMAMVSRTSCSARRWRTSMA